VSYGVDHRFFNLPEGSIPLAAGELTLKVVERFGAAARLSARGTKPAPPTADWSPVTRAVLPRRRYGRRVSL
jgi:hypothetical protein